MSTVHLTEEQRARLFALADDGHLTAEAVLQDAEAPVSPLHSLYDWDPAHAAREYWLDRSRQIIRAVVVHYVHTTYAVRTSAYVRDPEKPTREGGYVHVATLRRTKALARQELVAECERVGAALRRALGLAAVLGLEDEVEELLARVTGLRALVLAPAEEPAPAPPPS